jgi:3'-phosphoadenosine 5'-phosphosulfate sulfotransferase (PAPS reductase)/FAD synthetase
MKRDYLKHLGLTTQTICMNNLPVIAWWSGGVTSAVACKLAIEIYGIDNIRLVFIDTLNEDIDTYRFKIDCEEWYGKEIETIRRTEYSNIKEVWHKFLSLNVAHGAICSSELKRDLRVQFLKTNEFSYNIFGFDIDEPKRAKSMAKNYPEVKPIFPLLMHGLSKKDCIKSITEKGINIPRAYDFGFNNNNCLQTGCVQGGIGYWQLMKKIIPDNFYKMAKVEHELTDLKGKPVTMLKDQSKHGGLVFLLPHPNYPFVKDISMMKGRPPEPLTDCNGFCGVNDLTKKNKTEKEINYQ